MNAAARNDHTGKEDRSLSLSESNGWLREVVDFFPDATFVIDPGGKVIAWNRAIEEMTGVSAQDMVGKGDYEYAIPFYGERRPIMIDLALLPQEEIEKKYASITRVGSKLVGESYTPNLNMNATYLFATAAALFDPNGKAIGAIETIRDITERKKAEVALRQARQAAESAARAKS
ncbi:MAG: PAS domain-containing protein, partial [Chloroflexi bacterium]|nr:PAS domain-containing protein [Chloroflexota bacterium]